MCYANRKKLEFQRQMRALEVDRKHPQTAPFTCPNPTMRLGCRAVRCSDEESAAEVMSLESSGRGSVEMSLECQAHKLGLDPVDLLSGIKSE